MNVNRTKHEEGDRPPFLKSWKRIYALVLLNLALTILIFYFISRYFK